MEIAQSDAAAYFDWYRIETWKGYDERPDTEVTGNPSDDYERRAPGLGGMWEGVRYQYYEASDGHILFMASEQAFWKNFCEGVDRMDLFEKWPGKRIADHARGNTELQAILRDIFKTRTINEWIAFADEHNTTIAPANTPQTVRDDPQFQDRFDVDDARADERRRAAVPAARRRRGAPDPDDGADGRRAHRRGAHPRARLRRRQARQAQGHRRPRIATPAARGR